MILPTLAFGLAALMFFTMLGFRLSLATMILGHVAVITPFILRTTVASLSQLDPAQIDTSASLGAGALYTFRRVTMPVIRPGIVAGAFLAFMSLAILAGIGLTSALLARRALRPIDQVVRRARRIGEANLADRLPHPGTRDEIGRLVETLNDMPDLNSLSCWGESPRLLRPGVSMGPGLTALTRMRRLLR